MYPVYDKNMKLVGQGCIDSDDGERMLYIEALPRDKDWECLASECELILDWRPGGHSGPYYRLNFEVKTDLYTAAGYMRDHPPDWHEQAKTQTDNLFKALTDEE